MAEYVNPDVLISDEELESKLGDPSIRVIEVDEDTSLYGKGHIPGAIAWNWKTELHDPLRREFIDQKQLASLLKKSGVGPDTTVVLYAGNNNWFSAYTFWLLRYLGFDNVKLLNGGRKKWELENRPLTTDAPQQSVKRSQVVWLGLPAPVESCWSGTLLPARRRELQLPSSSGQ